ncbi:Heparan-alpha-glucosaminide N-acetyltransferase-like [Oopsacas minuta]|uniref:Heparan-alpha-glucosaminide N-acetyltransferase-like n=1 Tax=Oopsacas minuta TaxID=111878 RepID=A0AAV7K5J5_9METZ|nr:Heparan-alpha-glucosaminide N-acetyltransferase-like [Oopsacas minuta]
MMNNIFLFTLFLAVTFVPLNGVPSRRRLGVVNASHYITLHLLIEDCVSDKVHFNIRITSLSNNITVEQISLGCSAEPSFWTDESGLNIFAGKTEKLEYITTILLHSMIKVANSSSYTNNTFIFYGNQTQVSFWNKNNDMKVSSGPPSIDTALIQLTNSLYDNISLSGLSELCYECQYYPIFDDKPYIKPLESVSFEIDSRFLYTLKFTRRFYSNHSEKILYLPYYYQEQAIYIIHITQFNKTPDIWLHKKGNNTYLPLIVNCAIFVLLASIFTFLSLVLKFLNKKKIFMLPSIEKLINNELGGGTSQVGRASTTSGDINNSSHKDVSPAEEVPLLNGRFKSGSKKDPYDGKKERLKSLDTFRGLSLCIMIFVNYGGGGYWFFDHSTWNGITVADLVFPWFVWIMGVSMVYSFRGRGADSKLSLYYQIVRRSVILFGLGVLFVNNCYDLATCRVPGVLQRFAITYFVCASIEFIFLFVYRIKWLAKLATWIPNLAIDLYYTSFQWVIMFVIEIIWLAITFGLQFDDCPRGYLGPGGISHDGNYSDCTGGAAYYIDKTFFGRDHIYATPTCKEVYKTGPFDPEGMLGSLNSIVMCYFGVYAGNILLHHKGHLGRIIRWLIWALATGVVALALCEGKQNDGLIPINKNLWSLSFILSLTSMAFILLAALYVLIDVTKIWNGAPFRYVGLNSILIYMGHTVFQYYFPFRWVGIEDNHTTYLLSNEIGVAMWMAIAFYCDCIKFYIKV